MNTYFIVATNYALTARNINTANLLKLLYGGWLSLDDSFNDRVWIDLDWPINSKFWERCVIN